MAPNSYFFYDNERCELVPLEYGAKEKIVYNACLWIICGIVFAGIGITCLSKIAGTPAEIALKEENNVLLTQLSKTRKTINKIDIQMSHLAHTDNDIYRSVLGMKPISYDVRMAGVGGADIYSKFDAYDEKTSSMLKTTATDLASIQRRINIQKVSFEEIKNFYNKNKEKLAHLPVIRPVKGIILSGFGMRFHPVLHIWRMHEGIDLRAKVGTPVHATGDGIVTYAKRDGTYGRLLKINNGYGIETRFAHLSAYAKGIKPGVKVKRGEVVAYTGNTGITDGPHLHYEIRINGQAVNPLNYLFGDITPAEYNTFKKIAEENTRSLD